jgi:hypothetical protein
MSTNGGACRDMIAATHPMPGTDPNRKSASSNHYYKAAIGQDSRPIKRTFISQKQA